MRFFFFKDRDYGGCFETSSDFALAERVVVDFTEDWSKLFLQGGAILLSIQTGFSLVNAAVVCAIL